MTSPHTSPRIETKRELYRLFNEVPTLVDVQISYGRPPDIEDKHIVIGPVTGSVEISAMTGPGGPRQRDDLFEVAILVGAGQLGDTLEEAENKVAPILSAVEATLADYPTLPQVPEVLSATVSRIDGPDLAHIGDAQALAYAIVTVEVLARYTFGAP